MSLELMEAGCLDQTGMTRKDWIQFGALSALWGASYLFIKVALEDDLSPAVIVFARTAVAAAVLTPFALRARALRGLRARLPAVGVLALMQVAGPFLLISAGEQHLASSLTGILVATAPIFHLSPCHRARSGRARAWDRTLRRGSRNRRRGAPARRRRRGRH